MSLSLNKDVLSRFIYNDTFIETGTFNGGGVRVALDAGFKHIHSIEVSPVFYNKAVALFSDMDNVELYLGDSIEVLPAILTSINEPATFFLDSHFFSFSPALGSDGNRLSPSDVPLLLELDTIKSHRIKTHTILVDDRRALGKEYASGEKLSDAWLYLTEDIVIKKLLEINPKYNIYYVDSNNDKNDIIVAEVQ